MGGMLSVRCLSLPFVRLHIAHVVQSTNGGSFVLVSPHVCKICKRICPGWVWESERPEPSHKKSLRVGLRRVCAEIEMLRRSPEFRRITTNAPTTSAPGLFVHTPRSERRTLGLNQSSTREGSRGTGCVRCSVKGSKYVLGKLSENILIVLGEGAIVQVTIYWVYVTTAKLRRLRTCKQERCGGGVEGTRFATLVWHGRQTTPALVVSARACQPHKTPPCFDPAELCAGESGRCS